MSNKIKTFARLRPLLDKKSSHISYSAAGKDLTLQVPQESSKTSQNIETSYPFKFDTIFDTESTQEQVFNAIALPSIESAFSGYNSTIFAYGQTGSGKTFTITGGAEKYKDRGIIPRTLEYIFKKYYKSNSTKISVSYIEVYNESGYDLLDEKHDVHNAREKKRSFQNALDNFPKVQLLEDQSGNITLRNLSVHEAKNEEEALSLLFLGDTNRAIAETPMNQASTRSHCIFTIHISNSETGSNKVRKSKLHLVDLAGSERVTKTQVSGQLLNEAKFINLSLHYLEQVIVSLTPKSNKSETSHIPYRNSMMTSILRDSLGGNCVTSMIATLSVNKYNIHESVSTARFAQRVALVKNKAAVNEVVDVGVMLDRQKVEITRLKAEIALLNGKNREDEIDELECKELERLVDDYVEDENEKSYLEDGLLSLIGPDSKRLDFCYKLLKNKVLTEKLVDRVDSEIESENRLSTTFTDEEIMNLRDTLIQRDHEIDVLVRMLRREKQKTVGAGAGDVKQSVSLNHSDSIFSTKSFSSTPTAMTKLNNKRIDSMSTGRKEAFEQWKRQNKSESIRNLTEQREDLKRKYSKAKNLGAQMNKYRAFINQIKGQMSRADESLQDELRSQMEQNSVLFHQAKSELSELKPQVEMEQHLHEKTKKNVLEDFNTWWENEETRFSKLKPKQNEYNPNLYNNNQAKQEVQQINRKTNMFDNSKTFIKSSINPSESSTATITDRSLNDSQSIPSAVSNGITDTMPENISSKTSQHIRDFEEAAYRHMNPHF